MVPQTDTTDGASVGEGVVPMRIIFGVAFVLVVNWAAYVNEKDKHLPVRAEIYLNFGIYN